MKSSSQDTKNKKNSIVLVVDDEASMRKFFEVTLKREGYRVATAEGVTIARHLLAAEDFDLVLSDMRMDDGTGLEVLTAAKEKDADVPVIMMTAYASPEAAVEAMKLGAVDYLTKPFNVDEVRMVVRNNIRTRRLIHENRSLKEALSEARKPSLVYKSRKMRDLINVIERVAKMDTTILVTGESGTGKELIMQTIHEKSNRADAPFVSVNCGALPENLFESELFGYEKGSFTGADQRKTGLFESAKGGTIFLDEVGEMPLKMQIKLLRVLQEKKIRRVGGNEEIAVDFRLVSATNRDLQKEVKEGNFREDLYYRISVIPVQLPPLRERGEDIIPLIQHFLKKFADRYNEPAKEISSAALKAMECYQWPGNVRELENTIERIVALTPAAKIEPPNLPDYIVKTKGTPKKLEELFIAAEGIDLEAQLDDIRFRYMKASLEMTNGVQSKSCELLGMSFRSFRYYLSKGKEKGYFS